jgi:hypothetical protein
MGGGFGLTKAYFFTKQFKGTFKVKSKIGEGSTFIAQIPCPTSFILRKSGIFLILFKIYFYCQHQYQ